jgi:hypothetical protein
MRRLLLAVGTLLLVLGALPAGAATETSNVACPETDGRERLTLAGIDTTIESPAPYPALVSPVDTATAGAPVQPFRKATMEYQADFSPASEADLTIGITWEQFANDYDIFVYDGDGAEIGRSAAENPSAQVAAESVVIPGIEHCDRLSVVVTNFSGAPVQPLRYTVKTESRGTLACGEGDTAPGCAGKPAGAAPDSVGDPRSILYLSGDPGQTAMAHGFNDGVPTRSALTTTRPTSGKPNSFTRALLGNPTQNRNLLMAHFSKTYSTPVTKTGPASALVYVSSPTLAQTDGGILLVQLWADGTLLKEVKVPGKTVGAAPTAIKANFGVISLQEASRVTLQVGTINPVGTGAGERPLEPADTAFTIWYDSVQFPARVTLP